MLKLLLVLAIVVTVVALSAGWQFCACELANSGFRDDLQDLASQPRSRLGLAGPNSDDDLRVLIIRKALGHGIELDPSQVKIQRTGSGINSAIHLSADYTVTVSILVGSVTLHYTPTVQGHIEGAAGVGPDI